jgi:hypothetical protein
LLVIATAAVVYAFDVHGIVAGVAVMAAGAAVFLVARGLAAGRAPARPIERYARAHGIAYEREGTLPEATPLLCRGDRRFATEVATGELPGGLDGTLARYTYVVTEDGDERRHHFTVVVTRVPESVGFVPFLLCRHRRRSRASDDPHGGGYSNTRMLELESAAVQEHYRIETSDEQDQIWLRELFAPSFVAWLAARAPEQLSFELVEGVLCVYVPWHGDEPSALDRLVEASTHVTERLRGEALEEEGRAAAAITAPAAKRAARLRERLDTVQWQTAPPDAKTASRAYLPIAAREPGPWAKSLLVGAVVSAGVFARTLQDGAGDVALAVGLGVVALVIAALGLIRQGAARYGQEAFVREYARSRGLALEDGRRFHARNVRLPLPGIADHALKGRLGARKLEAELVLLSDRTNRRRPIYWDLLTTRVSPEYEKPAEEGPAGYQVRLHDEDLLVFRRARSPRARTARSLDRFSDEAARIVADLKRPKIG